MRYGNYTLYLVILEKNEIIKLIMDILTFDSEAYLRLQQEATRNKKRKPSGARITAGSVEVDLPDPRYVVRAKTGGQGSSTLGFAKGEVFSQNLEDQ